MFERNNIIDPKGIGVGTEVGKRFILNQLEKLVNLQNTDYFEGKLKKIREIENKLGVKYDCEVWYFEENCECYEIQNHNAYFHPRLAGLIFSLEKILYDPVEEKWSFPEDIDGNYLLPDGRILVVDEYGRFDIR